jgi:hypothetical protein
MHELVFGGLKDQPFKAAAHMDMSCDCPASSEGFHRFGMTVVQSINYMILIGIGHKTRQPQGDLKAPRYLGASSL